MSDVKRPMTVISARAGTELRYGRFDPNDPTDVELRVTLDWLKGKDLGIARMTPHAARVLAIQLLEAAEIITRRLEKS